MGSDAGLAAAAVEAVAKTYAFDEGKLSWVPSGSPPALVRLARTPQGTGHLTVSGQEVPLAELDSVDHVAPCFVTVSSAKLGRVGMQFEDDETARRLSGEVVRRKSDYERFEQYEPSSVQSYFQYYAKLGNQQNMLQDSVRTGTYRRAILENAADFQGKTAMDIGAGSGILSFFTAQAGASHVYAVEASSMADVVRLLADANQRLFPSTSVVVVKKPLESIKGEVPDRVDVLVSEPIGTCLFNERMIETYLCARDRYLKPGGRMFPSAGSLCLAPFSDAMLHWEQENKNVFWKNTNFLGIDLSAAAARSKAEHFRQPIVDYINPECLVSRMHTVRYDFATVSVESLHKIEVPFDFEVTKPCLVHGLASWFDLFFEGSASSVTLSTAPWCPGTHWYQIRFLLEVPLAVNAGQRLQGTFLMEANNLQSYYVTVAMEIAGTGISSRASRLDLKDPEYRFFTSPNAYRPPGANWGQQGTAAAAAAGQGQGGQGWTHAQV